MCKLGTTCPGQRHPGQRPWHPDVASPRSASWSACPRSARHVTPVSACRVTSAVKLDPPSRLPEVTNPFIRSLTPPVVPSIRIKYHARGHTEPWRVVKVRRLQPFKISFRSAPHMASARGCESDIDQNEISEPHRPPQARPRGARGRRLDRPRRIQRSRSNLLLERRVSDPCTSRSPAASASIRSRAAAAPHAAHLGWHALSRRALCTNARCAHGRVWKAGVTGQRTRMRIFALSVLADCCMPVGCPHAAGKLSTSCACSAAALCCAM